MDTSTSPLQKHFRPLPITWNQPPVRIQNMWTVGNTLPKILLTDNPLWPFYSSTMRQRSCRFQERLHPIKPVLQQFLDFVHYSAVVPWASVLLPHEKKTPTASSAGQLAMILLPVSCVWAVSLHAALPTSILKS